jgi:hypothetical protein
MKAGRNQLIETIRFYRCADSSMAAVAPHVVPRENRC